MYPQISEYVEAIKLSEDNFEQLKNLRPVLGGDGEPVFSCGNFAVVFKMREEQSGKLYALKCFTKEQEGRNESYKLIADELEYVSSNYLTPINYYENELFVDTHQTTETEFPVLLMDWVEGKTLDVYIKENINNRYALEMLVYQFNKLAAWLITQPFAHGDLKLDNIIMKEDGQLVLVDYDGIFVPAMKGQKAREIGSPGFRHPSRIEDDFNEHIDDFSIALISLALKAIALKPVLWKEFGGNDRLLFSERDFLDLSQSQVITALQPLMNNKELCTLYGIFMIAWAKNDLSHISYKLLNIEKKEEDIQVIVSAYLKGKSLIDAKEYEQAYNIFSSLEKNGRKKGRSVDGIGNLCGYVLGANGLGYMFAHGYYVQQKCETAAGWFKKAANNDFSMAQYNLGICYKEGIGVEKNQQKADQLFLLAADKNFGPAQAITTFELYEVPESYTGSWNEFESVMNADNTENRSLEFLI